MTKQKLGRNIVVLTAGFVYVGDVTIEGDLIVIEDAQCIRRWGTEHGLGQLAISGPTEATILDAATTVRAPKTAVVHFILCTGWKVSA
jgi:hypothetical protein